MPRGSRNLTAEEIRYLYPLLGGGLLDPRILRVTVGDFESDGDILGQVSSEQPALMRLHPIAPYVGFNNPYDIMGHEAAHNLQFLYNQESALPLRPGGPVRTKKLDLEEQARLVQNWLDAVYQQKRSHKLSYTSRELAPLVQQFKNRLLETRLQRELPWHVQLYRAAQNWGLLP